MLILNASEVYRALPMRRAIEAMKQAFAALSDGRAEAPLRTHLRAGRNAGISLFMPAFIDDPSPANQALVVKAVSLFDGNAARGLNRIQAAVLVLEPDTGRPAALLEGATLTAIRTAAASGAATDLLARPDSAVLGILGAGVQARYHLEAVCAVRPIREARIYAPTVAKVERLIDEMTPRVKAALHAAESPRDALAGADVVCAASTSSVPVFADGDLLAGAHVNAVGSFTPQAREVPAETVMRSLVVVDSREAAWQEAGDLIQPLEAGLISRDHIHAELGELVLGRNSCRTDSRQITLFKSVGSAVQDAVAARTALACAREAGLGIEVAL